MQAQETALWFQGHLEQARQVPGTHLQDASQLQSPMEGVTWRQEEPATWAGRGHLVRSSAVMGILKLVLPLSLNLMQVTSHKGGP